MFLATPLVGLALVLAGCGGSDDSGPTKAEYITKADAVCKAGDDAGEKATTAAVTALGTESPTPEQLTTIASSIVLPQLETQVASLKALEKPKDDADAIDAIYSELDKGIAAAKADPSVLASSEGGSNPFAGANEKAKAFGFKECGAE
jgi:hypothetical protein